MAHRTISLEDIRTIPDAMELFKSGDIAAFNAMLYDIGFDLERGVDMEIVLHRPMTSQKEVFGPRWVGHERVDPEWMNSGNASQLNKLERLGIVDPEFQKELVAMSATPNYTAMFIDHLIDNQKPKKKTKTKSVGEE